MTILYAANRLHEHINFIHMVLKLGLQYPGG